MLRAGDEFMQTQDGNNNPYNQDNETTWLDWARLRQNQDIYSFFKRAIGPGSLRDDQRVLEAAHLHHPGRPGEPLEASGRYQPE
jgi:pullulanase/glycogen debranching enzyme